MFRKTFFLIVTIFVTVTLSSCTSRVTLVDEEEVVDFETSYQMSYVVTSTGKVYGWGDNQYFGLIDEEIEKKNSPYEITDLFPLNDGEQIINIHVDYTTHSAYTNTNRLFIWGNVLPRYYNEPSFVEVTDGLGLQENENIVNVIGHGGAVVVLTSMSRVLLVGGGDSRLMIAEDVDTEVFYDTAFDVTNQMLLEEGEVIEQLYGGNGEIILTTSLGKVIGWGYDLGRQPNDLTSTFELEEDETITKINVGSYMFTAFTSHNRVLAWGRVGEYDEEVPTLFSDRIDLHDGEVIEDVFFEQESMFFLTSENRLIFWGILDHWEPNLYDYTPLDPEDITDTFDLHEDENISYLVIGYDHVFVVTDENRTFEFVTKLHTMGAVQLYRTVKEFEEVKLFK